MIKILAVLFLATSAFAADLQSQLQAMASAYQGKVAVYAKDLKSGATVAINADTPVPTASVIKLPIMIEAMYQVKAGKLHLDDKVTVTKDDQVGGSGVLNALQPGLQLTLEDAITLMIITSDNTAANLVMDRVGIPAVNDRLTAMGLKNTHLYKKVFKPATGLLPDDYKTFGLGKTTAREMAIALESIERCDLKDAPLCKLMLDILEKQQWRNGIPHYFDGGESSVHPESIANKTGSLDEVRNDAGIVFTKTSGPIIISVFTWDNRDHRWNAENAGEMLIANIARLVVETWAQPEKTAVPDSGHN